MPSPLRSILRPSPQTLAGLALGLAAACASLPARAACDVEGARIEETIAQRPALQEPANAQTLRDLRTLRDAAIVLDAYKHPAECERVIAIAKQLAADPDRAIELGGDTDEDRAESVMEAREPKSALEKGTLEKDSDGKGSKAPGTTAPK